MPRIVPPSLLSAVMALGFTGVARPAAAQALASSQPPNWFLYAIITLGVFLMLFFIVRVSQWLVRSGWNLAEALSEATEITETDAAGATVKRTRLVASSSRLIALIGLAGILSLFMVQGLLLVWQAARGDSLATDARDFATYLFYGGVMFAPYLVNKLSGIFSQS